MVLFGCNSGNGFLLRKQQALVAEKKQIIHWGIRMATGSWIKVGLVIPGGFRRD